MNAIRNILNFSHTYELPIARGYVRHWKMTEAVREILQNAIDSESPFEYELRDDNLLVHSRNSHLTPETLLLGKTSKADDKDAIGSFGEGYKIALLVLAREGYKVEVLNRDRVWKPFFQFSNQFKSEVLCISDAPAAFQNEGVTFVVGGLSPDDIRAIRDSCLFMQENIGRVTQTPFGTILRERPGKLYVGGLFVCKTELMFGYDVKPEYLKLERDRQTVSSFDLQWLTKDMWMSTERFDEIANLMKADTPDLKYSEYNAPALVKEACYKLFRAENPGAVVAKDQKELEALVQKGMTKVVVVSSPSYASAIRGAPEYAKNAPPPVSSPQQILHEWFKDHRDELRRSAIVSFKDILKLAGDWRQK